MFETSMVQARAKAARGRAGLFAISLAAHTAVIIGVGAISVASVDFPAVAPDEVANAPVFMPITMPPPLGTPNGGAPPKPAVTPPQRQETPPPPTQITAPPDIPNDVPVVESPLPGTSEATGAETGTGGTEPGPVGQPWGVDGGLGPLDAGPAVVDTPAVVENKVYTPGGEVKPPVLIRRVDPGYPEIMRRTRMKATVIVKCVIDKNGNVRDAEIVLASMPPFNDAVMNAIKQWRYQPGSYRGQAVDTLLHVTVNFGIQ